MSAGRARLPPRHLLGIHRITDVPDEDSFVDFLVRVAAIAGSILERRDHQIAVEIDLARGCGHRSGEELDHLRIRRVGDIDDAPTVRHKMAHVEIPMVAHMFDRHLERFVAAQIAVADRLHIAGFPTGRNLVSEGALRRRA